MERLALTIRARECGVESFARGALAAIENRTTEEFAGCLRKFARSTID